MSFALFTIRHDIITVTHSSDLSGLGRKISFNTPANFSSGMLKIVDAINQLCGTQKPVAIVGGLCGLLNEDKSGLENDAVLDKWIGKSIVGELSKSFSVPVYLEDEVALAGVGEAVFGAGRNLPIVAYHIIDDVIDGVKIENGKIDLASVSFEPGHQVLDIDRTILGDDIEPTLENLVSGTAIRHRYGFHPKDIPQSDLLWSELAAYLAQGLRNTILYWSPDVLVLGGNLIDSDPHIDIDMVRKHTVETLAGFVPSPLICKASLGEDAPFFGGLHLLSENHVTDVD